MYTVGMGAPPFSANKVSQAPIVDTRSFFASSDFVLMGVAATLFFVFLSMVGTRKARPYIRRQRRARRRRAIAYHTGELRRLKRSRRSARSIARVRPREAGAFSDNTMVKIGKGQAVPFSSLPPSLQKQIRRAA